jgi:hypothetical protein
MRSRRNPFAPGELGRNSDVVADNAAWFPRRCLEIARKALPGLYGSERTLGVTVRCRTDCRRRIVADC